MGFHRILLVAVASLFSASVYFASSAGDAKDAKGPANPILPLPIFEKLKDEKSPPKSDPAKTNDTKNEKKIDNRDEALDEEILRRAELSTEGDALIRFFQKRTLPDSERPAIERLVRQLGSPDYRVREKASLALTTRGVAVLDVLRSHHATPGDPEMNNRIERALQQIHQKDVAPEVPAAAMRTLARRKPANLVETLIAYLPYADNEDVLEETRAALTKHALHDGKIQPQLLSALTDRSPMRRATAGEVVCRTGYAQHKESVRKLLLDSDAFVRYRTALSLAHARQRDAIPVLIDTIADLPLNAAWQSEDFLLRLAGIAAGTPPPDIAMANDKNTREKCRTGWQTWWKKHGDKIDLAKIEETPKLLGRTLIVLLDQGKVMELGRDNQPRWEVKGLVFPLDAQLVDEDRLLVAEYHANRVTERNTRGEIIWQAQVASPLVAQRLANGNTFVSTDSQFLEYDKAGREVLSVIVSDEGRKVMKAMKLPNGEIATMLVDGRFVRFDAKGQEVHSFPLAIGARLFGGRVHVLPTGRVLIPQNAEGKVSEYDAKGKIVWEVNCEQPIAATRLPNGNTIITSMNPAVGAVEVDRAGTEVWSYHNSTRVTRAIRR